MNRISRYTAGLLWAISLCADAASGLQPSGPFEIGSQGHILVPVAVDGGPEHSFAVDTAASHTVLDRETFSDLLPAGAGSGDSAAHGAHGTLAATLTRLDSMSLWDTESKNVDAVLLPIASLAHHGPPDFVGVLGVPYLSQFLVDIDFENRELALRDRNSSSSCDICRVQDPVALGTLLGGLKSIQLEVDGVPVTAILDTGAARSVLNPRAAEQLQASEDAAGEPPMASFTIGSTPVTRQARPATLALPVFTTLGLENEPAMILGLDILASGRLVLDLAGSSAWFLPSATL